MSLRIDHVTIANSNLHTLERAFTDVGLIPDYGGPHSSGETHMDVLGFDDGSYIELIATIQPGMCATHWGEFIATDAGPCGWTVATPDLAGDVARIAALDIPVAGPVTMSRRRPDGALIEWRLAFPGGGSPGSRLPCLIQDTTPRDLRVHPSASVSGSELTGVVGVVLGVDDLAAASDLYQRVYGWPTPATAGDANDADFGARLARFAGTPITLAAPLDDSGWLAERLRHYGPAPCAYLLGSRDLAFTTSRLPLGPTHAWFGHDLRWLDPARLAGVRLGVMAL